MSGQMIEVWRGSVRQWEVDEMGHWNTQFYLARASEGLAVLFSLTGLPGLFSPASSATIALDEHHIRFHREASAGAPLHMVGGFLEVGETAAVALLVLHHSANGQIAATFRVRVSYADVANGFLPLPWPRSFCDRAAGLLVAAPKEAAARGTDDSTVVLSASRDRAIQFALKRTAIGCIEREATDIFGRARPQKLMDAVANGVKQLTGPLRALVVEMAERKPASHGGAVLESRIIYGRTCTAGDCFEVWAGLQKIDSRTMSLIFWMLDPVKGDVFAAMQSIAIVFDLNERAIVEISPAAKQALTEHLVAGIAL